MLPCNVCVRNKREKSKICRTACQYPLRHAQPRTRLQRTVRRQGEATTELKRRALRCHTTPLLCNDHGKRTSQLQLRKTIEIPISNQRQSCNREHGRHQYHSQNCGIASTTLTTRCRSQPALTLCPWSPQAPAASCHSSGGVPQKPSPSQLDRAEQHEGRV